MSIHLSGKVNNFHRTVIRNKYFGQNLAARLKIIHHLNCPNAVIGVINICMRDNMDIGLLIINKEGKEHICFPLLVTFRHNTKVQTESWSWVETNKRMSILFSFTYIELLFSQCSPKARIDHGVEGDKFQWIPHCLKVNGLSSENINTGSSQLCFRLDTEMHWRTEAQPELQN